MEKGVKGCPMIRMGEWVSVSSGTGRVMEQRPLNGCCCNCRHTGAVHSAEKHFCLF